MTRSIYSKLAIVAIAGLTLGALASAPAFADDRRHGRGGGHGKNYNHGGHGGHGKNYGHRGGHGGKVVIVKPQRRHHAPRVVFVHPRRPVYYHHVKRHHRPARRVVYVRTEPWFVVTALTLHLLHDLNAQAQYAHRTAQVQATAVPVGQAIVWQQGNAQGAVAAVRDGYSNTGEYCREFQNQVTIGGRTQQAYGTACLQPDGSWRKL